jgi:hypothetical protein
MMLAGNEEPYCSESKVGKPQRGGPPSSARTVDVEVLPDGEGEEASIVPVSGTLTEQRTDPVEFSTSVTSAFDGLMAEMEDMYAHQGLEVAAVGEVDADMDAGMQSATQQVM